MSKLITLDNLRTFKAKLDETISSSGGGTKTVNFNSQAYTTTRPIDAEDLAILSADRNNTITLDNRTYRLVDNEVTSGRLFYIHLGEDGIIYGISITKSTRKWDKYEYYDLNRYIEKNSITGDSSGVIYHNIDTDEFYRVPKKRYKHTVNFYVDTEDGYEAWFFFTVESDREYLFSSMSEIEDGCYTAYSSNVDNIIGTLQVLIDNLNGVYQYGGAVCVGNNSYSYVRSELYSISDYVEWLF